MASNNNLLSFVNSASSNIQEALGKPPKRRRNVNVRKFAENRLKRLDGARKPRCGLPSSSSTKSKSAQPKPLPARHPAPSNAIRPPFQHSYTWPETFPSPVSTPAFTTTNIIRYSEPLVCGSSQLMDPELESLLSEFESPALSRHGSHDSVCTISSCTPPTTATTETPVYQPYSPYSDYSDEFDSAYCSPVESARVNCSPSNLTTALPDWSSSSDWLPPMTNTCTLQEVTSGCAEWMTAEASPLTSSPSSISSVYDQGPPMTPTVSELLEQYNHCQ